MQIQICPKPVFFSLNTQGSKEERQQDGNFQQGLLRRQDFSCLLAGFFFNRPSSSDFASVKWG